MNDYAGKFLQDYERGRYGIFERAMAVYTRIMETIIVPTGAVEFPDVSFYQGMIAWDTMAANTSAVILRLGQGAWTDDQFQRNYYEAKARNLKVGGYWFFDGRTSPQAQADLILGLMRNRAFDMELFIDWERSYNGAYEGLENVVSLMQKVEALGLSVKAVGMYTGYYWFVDHTNSSTHAAQFNYLKTRPLWLAWYSAASVVKIPPPWTEWTHWQYGTPVLNYGQETVEIDMNRFNGDQRAFFTRYGGTTTPPPTGGTMHYFELRSTVSTEIRAIRAAHPTSHIQGSRIGEIWTGSFAKAVEKYTYTADVTVNGTLMAKTGDVWWHVFEANGKAIDGWCAEIHKGVRYLNLTEIGTPEPPPPVSDIAGVRFSGEVVFDYTDGRQEVWHVTDVPFLKGPVA